MKLKAYKEKRFLNDRELNVRGIAEEGGARYIEGYASLFNRQSKLIYESRKGKMELFYEVILPGAYDEVLRSEKLDVIHTINHSINQMVARTKSGTLQLSVDEKGLKYRFLVPNTTLGNDLYEMVQRGDYYESSFVFTVNDQDERLETRNDGNKYRIISKVSGLYDTSTVVNGAYSDTDVVARNEKLDILFEEATQSEVQKPTLDQKEMEQREFDIFLLKNKYL
jgi:HK97 family phage prohead protease